MAIDYDAIAEAGGIPKVRPGVLRRDDKRRSEAKAWRQTKKAVDKRDEVEGAPVCFITGKRLQVVNGLDEWTFRDRAHIRPRSREKARKNDDTNVLSVSRAVHRLIDASALLLFNKRGQPAKSIGTIDHVAWNRRMVKRGEEPCRIRKGLAVVELDQVRD